MIMLLSIFLLTVSISLYYKTGKQPKTLPPGPPPLPLIGNLYQLATASELHVYLWKLSQKYGPIIHLKLGSTPLIVVSCSKLAKEVLKTQDLAFCSRPKSLALQKISYNYTDIIFSPYNDYWREMRKTTAIHLFSLKKVQSFRPIREDEISRLITKISQSALSHQPVDLSEMAMALSSSLICRIAFGDDHGSENRRFKKLLHDLMEISISFFVSDYFPAFSWVDRVSGMAEKVDATSKKLDSFYQEIIDQHLDPNRAKTDDILDILIQLKQQRNSSSIQLTWDNIKALLMNIFIAATDTSSAAIVWTMTALIKSPNAMKTVQAEIRNLIGEKGRVDEDDLGKLPYLKAVINEAFRLYPTAPLLIPRETTQKCILEGYEIQPKTMVYVNTWAIGRDPDSWENPDEFMPERFLDNNIDIKGQDFEVLPFGSGRRMCPGMLMGLANVETTLANLLYTFDWELPFGVGAEDVDTDPMPGFALQKKNALVLQPKLYCV